MAQQQPQGGGLLGLLLVGALVYFTWEGSVPIIGGSPISVEGLTAVYFRETDEPLSDEHYNIYYSKAPGSPRALLESSAHKTAGDPDVRYLDKDSDLSRCLPVASDVRRRWQEQGSPLPWRGLYSPKGYYEGKPETVADEAAKINSIR